MTSSSDAGPALAQALLADNRIDRNWLDRVLGQAGFDGELVDVGYEMVGTGQMGDNIRCRLAWSDDDGADPAARQQPGDRPSSVILKLPSADETSRNTGAATGAYRKEIGFYRDAAPSVAMRVPTVHHLWEDPETNRFILVMEDIAPAEQGNQLTGCSLERAELAVEAAADLHGSTWDLVDELGRLEWLAESPTRVEDRLALWNMVYPGFVARYRDRLSPEELAFSQWMNENFGPWLEALGQRQCLVHGDFRLDNILYGLGRPAPPITTVDWQTPVLGPALHDVAYFLGCSVPPVELEANEADLLDRYRQRLGGQGVQLSSSVIEEGYRLASPAAFVMAVIASQIVVQTDRGDEMFLVMASGSAGLARRLDLASAIG